MQFTQKVTNLQFKFVHNYTLLTPKGLALSSRYQPFPIYFKTLLILV